MKATPTSLLAPKQPAARRPTLSDLFNSPLLPQNSSFKSRGPASTLSLSFHVPSTAPLTPPYTPSPPLVTLTTFELDPSRLSGDAAAKDWASAAPLLSPFSPSSFPTSHASPLFPIRHPSTPLHDRSSSSSSSSMAKKKVKAKGKASYAALKAQTAAKTSHPSTDPHAGVEPTGSTSYLLPTSQVRDPYFVPPSDGDPHPHPTTTASALGTEHAVAHSAYGHKARARSLSPGMQRRGRSTRPRLLWRSTVDANVLRVLDGHHLKVYGSKVPRLRGPGSEEGRLWSEELDRSGL